ncbi:MAG: hypothetical protein II911_04940 [Clostridia bacterium]|nr:hypothetical protein [Clostridia bacterium]MBR0374275.1 hypothetical protein [Mogibacterium sp.]
MSRKKKLQTKANEQARKQAIRQIKRMMALRVMGISIISATVLIVATKILFDEIFVGDDWSDVDWGEGEEDYGVDID